MDVMLSDHAMDDTSSDPLWSTFVLSSTDGSGLCEASVTSPSDGRKKASKNKKNICQRDGDTMRIDLTGWSEEEVQSLTDQLINRKNISRPSQGEKRDRKAELSEFLQRYSNGNYADVAVAKMRHMIPLFLMEVYSDVYGQYSYKVKGMWEKKPRDWPSSVQFVDPNNNVKSATAAGRGSKPTKDVLIPMLEHLVKKYKDKQSKAPQQVEDTDYVDLGSGEIVSVNLNPIAELQCRLEAKLSALETSQKSVKEYIPALRKYLDLLLHYTSECLLMRAHILEAFVDILSSKGFLPINWEEKLVNIQDYAGRSVSVESSEACTSVLQTSTYDRYATTSSSPSHFNLKPVDGSAGNSCEREEDICPRMNIKTRGATGNQLLSELDLNLNLRQDVLSFENDVDNSCCGNEVSECARMQVENGAVGGADEHGSNISLSDITGDPQYDGQVLLDVLDKLASGETENSVNNCVSETAANEYVGTAGDCSNPNQTNYQEMELAQSPLYNLMNAHVGDLPEQAEARETSDAGAPLIPVSVFEAMNGVEPPSVKSPSQHLAEAMLPLALSTMPALEKQRMPPVTLISQVPHPSHLWPQQVRLQQSSAGGFTYFSVTSPTEQAPLTGSFEQLTLQNNGQFHGSESPPSYPLRIAMHAGMGSHGLAAVNQPGADWSSTADASRYPRSINSPSAPRTADVPNGSKRSAPIPVMVEAVNLEDSAFTVPTKKPRQSFQRQQ